MAICSSTSSLALQLRVPRPRSRRPARASQLTISRFGQRLRTKTATREQRGDNFEGRILGGRADRVMSPRSTWGRKASCCALLKRWISSTKTMVRRPMRGALGIGHHCFDFLDAAEHGAERQRTPHWSCARSDLRQRRFADAGRAPEDDEPISSRSICVRSGLPGPSRCSWPINSSSVRGRMRSARGRVRSPGLSLLGMVWKRLMVVREKLSTTKDTSLTKETLKGSRLCLFSFVRLGVLRG